MYFEPCARSSHRIHVTWIQYRIWGMTQRSPLETRNGEFRLSGTSPGCMCACCFLLCNCGSSSHRPRPNMAPQGFEPLGRASALGVGWGGVGDLLRLPGGFSRTGFGPRSAPRSAAHGHLHEDIACCTFKREMLCIQEGRPLH